MVKTNSNLQIIVKHTFTLFNVVNVILAVMVALVGSYKNMLFIFIAVFNTLISIVNEIRAKKIVDQLKIISEKNPKVVRKDGKTYEVTASEVKKGDIVVLGLGDQVMFDSIVLEGEIEVNEANITGEQGNERKSPGETLTSGSFVVAGICKTKVTATLDESTLSKLEKSAHEIKTADSKLFTLMSKIVRYISYALVPIGVLLLWSRFRVAGTTTEVAVTSTVAALINMIPEGLILLTSSVLALATIRLSKRQVLVQDLYAIETLARIDTICLDKTGTLTTGRMQVVGLIPAEEKSETDLKGEGIGETANEATEKAVGTAKTALVNALELILGYLPADNATSTALHAWASKTAKKRARTEKQQKNLGKTASIPAVTVSALSSKGTSEMPSEQNSEASAYTLIPFSSDRKFSGIKNQREEYLLGALEFVTNNPQIIRQGQKLAAKTEPATRVLALIHKDCQKSQEKLLGLVVLKDEIRKDAREIIRYFYENDVDVRVISGDNLATVRSIAETVGVKELDGVDLTTLNSKTPDYEALVSKYHLFTRVTPVEKQGLIRALQKQGRTVAMTGDGVNDILAMKAADASIAIGEGADAARRAAKIVLINSGFEAVPSIIAEGRQTINNLERSTTLFLTKTVYASILAVVFVILPLEYPFSPIEMSLLNVLCIGLPGLILALEKNTARIKNQFITNIRKYSVPTGLIIAIAAIMLAIFYQWAHINWAFSRAELTTLSAILVFSINFCLLYAISRPLNRFRGGLLCLILTLFLVALLTPVGPLIFEFRAIFG